MTLNTIINAVASGYYAPSRLLAYWNAEESQPRLNPEGGDSLAALIVQELFETYHAGASDAEQLESAMDALQDIAADFGGCIESLYALKGKTEQGKETGMK